MSSSSVSVVLVWVVRWGIPSAASIHPPTHDIQHLLRPTLPCPALLCSPAPPPPRGRAAPARDPALIGLPLPEGQIPDTLLLLRGVGAAPLEQAEAPPVERLQRADGGGSYGDNGPAGGADGDQLLWLLLRGGWGWG